MIEADTRDLCLGTVDLDSFLSALPAQGLHMAPIFTWLNVSLAS